MNLSADLYNTYSIVARDPETGQLGAAVQTHQMGVGKRVIWLEPGLGALASQSLSNASFGPMALTMLKEGIPPDRIIAALVASDEGAKWRQIGLVDAQGRAAAWTGENCIREASHQTGENFSIQANMMTHPTVVPAMVEAFTRTGGDLAQRMMAALQAAQAEGGDIRGMQSAALKVVSGNRTTRLWESDYDIRVDEHGNPVEELDRLVRLRHAQILDAQGYELLEKGEKEQALALWQSARAEAPEMEEFVYWQAVALADDHNDIATAADLLRAMLAADAPRRKHWIDLVRRLVACGLFKNADRAEALLAAL